MGCPQRFYLGEIRNQIAFTPPTQGTYNIALTKTDASGTSTVATSVADVDTPAGWTTAYKFTQTHGRPLYGHTHQDVYSYAGVTGSVSGLTSSSQVSWNTGPGSQTVNVSNLPRHEYVNVFASVYPGSLPIGTTVKIYLDGELVVTTIQDDNEEAHFTLGGSKILIGSSDHATIRVEVSEIPSTTQWYLASAGIETFLPTVSLSVDKDHVSEAGLEDTSNPNGLHERTISFTATRNIPYTTAEYNAMTPAVRDLIFPSMSVPVKWSGEAANGNDVSALPDNIVIPAGSLSGDVKIVAADDAVPEFTEKLTGTITTPPNTVVPNGMEKATIEIIDNDLKITGLPEYLKIGDLKEVSLQYPSEIKTGAIVSLSWDGGKFRVWKDSQKSELLTESGSSSVVWISGVSDAIPSKVYVEALTQSAIGNDSYLTLSDGDASAYSPPNFATSVSVTSRSTVNTVGVSILHDEEDLWWFGGEDAVNYNESIALNYSATTPNNESTSYTWAILGNTSAVDFMKYGVNQGDSFSFTGWSDDIQLVSTGGSNSMNDVSIQLSLDGQVKCVWNTTVKMPASANMVEINPYPYYEHSFAGLLGGTLDTWILLRIDDQFGRPVPNPLELNESFDKVVDVIPNNWGQPMSAGNAFTKMDSTLYSWQSTPSYMPDHYGMGFYYGFASPSPVLPTAPSAGTLVQTCVQYYHVGSVVPGKGLLVSTHTVNFYLGYARWSK